jgi:hypothetical protein
MLYEYLKRKTNLKNTLNTHSIRTHIQNMERTSIAQ